MKISRWFHGGGVLSIQENEVHMFVFPVEVKHFRRRKGKVLAMELPRRATTVPGANGHPDGGGGKAFPVPIPQMPEL